VDEDDTDWDEVIWHEIEPADFSLEHALRCGAAMLKADHNLIMELAQINGQSICYTLSRTLQLTRSFFGGSISRATWGAPKFESDLFVQLDDVHRGYLDQSPTIIFEEIARTLRHHCSFERDKQSGRVAVGDGKWRGNGPVRPASIIVVPAFTEGRGLLIPDGYTNTWICVDPGRLESMAKAADGKQSNWRELVRIAKTWNNRDEKFDPFIKPGLLIEVMAMEIVKQGLDGDLAIQLVALFEMLYKRIDEEWKDPAGLGPPLTSYMTPNRRAWAKDHLKDVWLTLAKAKRAEGAGDFREAKHLARSVLGRIVPTAPPGRKAAGLAINQYERWG
jgi:hypothetical protein